jgi:hypothetical protein
MEERRVMFEYLGIRIIQYEDRKCRKTMRRKKEKQEKIQERKKKIRESYMREIKFWKIYKIGIYRPIISLILIQGSLL